MDKAPACECKMIKVSDKAGRAIRNTSRKSFRNHQDYMVWQSVKNRCSKKSNSPEIRKYYKSIKVSEAWAVSFVTFNQDLGDRPTKQHSLDRVDNSLGYCKHNCKWATKFEQSMNRRGVYKDGTLPSGVRFERDRNRYGVMIAGKRIGRYLILSDALSALNKVLTDQLRSQQGEKKNGG